MNNKGISLFELIAVIIVIGVIATIALPSVSSFMNKGSLTTFLTYEKSMEDGGCGFGYWFICKKFIKILR